MTKQHTHPALRIAVLTASIAAAAAPPMVALAQTTPILGAATSSELTGTVTVVNQEKRMMTIETPEGHFVVLHVPDEVSRLDEVKIGNRVTITETEALLVDLKKGGDSAPISVTQDSMMERDPGTKPSGAIVDTITVKGEVQSVDRANSTVTIRGPADTVTLAVRSPELLSSLVPGDGVEASYMRVVSGGVTFD